MSAGLSGREGNSLRVIALKSLLCNSPCLYDDLATWPILSEKAGKWSNPEVVPSPQFLQSPTVVPCPKYQSVLCMVNMGGWLTRRALASSPPVPVGSTPSFPAYLGSCSTAGSSSRLLLSSCDSTPVSLQPKLPALCTTSPGGWGVRQLPLKGGGKSLINQNFLQSNRVRCTVHLGSLRIRS